ncbi:MAG: receptor ligand binding region family protein, partial [Ramlibacter sp.]|nr:receptor ligand binding region family protein [Ramlibacter sp.]
MHASFSPTTWARAAAALTLAAAGATAHAADPVKVGLMLPSSGTFADLGKWTVDGFKLYVQQQGGKLGGRTVEYITLD